MNKLDEICARKRDHVATQKQARPLTELQAMLADSSPPRGFAAALRRKVDAGECGLIAEIKKASPSHGLIREDFSPADLAQAYEQGGAACLSVLTDAPYFQGRDDYLNQARMACPLPALRKDFMVDTYQILESRLLGADSILLIMAALSDDEARTMHEKAQKLDMDVLAEVHDEAELERVLTYLPGAILGINNRNLKTLQTDLSTTERLAPMIPNGRLAVSESGIADVNHIARIRQTGVNCFLVGESLMRQPDVKTATRLLLQG